MNLELIEFKGKCLETGKWLFGFLTFNKETQKAWIGNFAFGNYWHTEVKPETVTRAIGQTDSEDNLVFLGDILEHEDGYKVLVKEGEYYQFGSGNSVYGVYLHCYECDENGSDFDFSSEFKIDGKIIGNSIDNPELMPKESEE